MKILYASESISSKNKNEFFSMDESLINHKKGRQIWLLGVINNQSKEFRIEGTFNRDASTIAKFIQNYIEKGNTIVFDMWAGFHFLDDANSGYTHISNNHHNGIFGIGLQSTSHIEAIWNIIKNKIKNIYYVIPNKHFLQFFREAEYCFKIRVVFNGGGGGGLNK